MTADQTRIITVLSALWISLAASAAAGVFRPPDNAARPPGPDWFSTTFFSLKRGNSIGPARFMLHDNGTFEFVIEDEAVQNVCGSYTVSGSGFTAEARFSVMREKPCSYVFSFTGLALFKTYVAGMATLREYIEENTLIQEIPFLFFSTSAPEKSAEKRFPF